MKLYGYKEGHDNEQEFMTLTEVTLMAGPLELRGIAKVLVDIASEMESTNFDHVHLTDRMPHLEGGPELVVMKDG